MNPIILPNTHSVPNGGLESSSTHPIQGLGVGGSVGSSFAEMVVNWMVIVDRDVFFEDCLKVPF